MMHVVDAGVMAYRPAWEMQLALHEQVVGGEWSAGALMLVEHPPVVTIGRRPNAHTHLLAPPQVLAARGVEVVETDRGGDITFHGPGQMVAYPIVPLNAYGLNLHGYMRFLEGVVIETLGRFGIEAMRDPLPGAATGVWVKQERDEAPVAGNQAEHLPSAKEEETASRAAARAQRVAKICALGIKVRRWVTFHGIALNVCTDLSFFELINPCGLSRPVTSMERLGVTAEMGQVKGAFTECLEHGLGDLRDAASWATRQDAE